MNLPAPNDPLPLVFVLVEPARPENVGAAARAIKTMGFKRLRIVRGCDLQPEAYWLAHESGEILDQAEHFETLEAALADVDFSIATGARRRLVRDTYMTPSQAITAIQDKQASAPLCALVFGRESSGLTSAEMLLCSAASTVPMAVEQPSLNLAQAVMLYAWEANRATQQEGSSAPDVDRFRHVLASGRHLLTELGFAEEENIHGWLEEVLARGDDRSLGLLMNIMQRINQRLTR